MRKSSLMLIAAAVIELTASQRSLAADIVRRPPAPGYAPPLPIQYLWTGCYIGGNIGWGWGRETVAIPNLGETTGQSALAGVSLGPVTGNTSGVLGGGQVGLQLSICAQLGDRH